MYLSVIQKACGNFRTVIIPIPKLESNEYCKIFKMFFWRFVVFFWFVWLRGFAFGFMHRWATFQCHVLKTANAIITNDARELQPYALHSVSVKEVNDAFHYWYFKNINRREEKRRWKTFFMFSFLPTSSQGKNEQRERNNISRIFFLRALSARSCILKFVCWLVFSNFFKMNR